MSDSSRSHSSTTPSVAGSSRRAALEQAAPVAPGCGAGWPAIRPAPRDTTATDPDPPAGHGLGRRWRRWRTGGRIPPARAAALRPADMPGEVPRVDEPLGAPAQRAWASDALVAVADAPRARPPRPPAPARPPRCAGRTEYGSSSTTAHSSGHRPRQADRAIRRTSGIRHPPAPSAPRSTGRWRFTGRFRDGAPVVSRRGAGRQVPLTSRASWRPSGHRWAVAGRRRRAGNFPLVRCPGGRPAVPAARTRAVAASATQPRIRRNLGLPTLPVGARHQALAFDHDAAVGGTPAEVPERFQAMPLGRERGRPLLTRLANARAWASRTWRIAKGRQEQVHRDYGASPFFTAARLMAALVRAYDSGESRSACRRDARGRGC